MEEKKAIRSTKGTFAKGSVGNPNGRPKKADVEAKQRANLLSSDFKTALASLSTTDDRVDFIIDYLLQNADTKDEVFKYVKEFGDFFKSKKKSVENKTTDDKTITIQWQTLPKQEELKNVSYHAIKEIGESIVKETLDI